MVKHAVAQSFYKVLTQVIASQWMLRLVRSEVDDGLTCCVRLLLKIDVFHALEVIRLGCAPESILIEYTCEVSYVLALSGCLSRLLCKVEESRRLLVILGNISRSRERSHPKLAQYCRRSLSQKRHRVLIKEVDRLPLLLSLG